MKNHNLCDKKFKLYHNNDVPSLFCCWKINCGIHWVNLKEDWKFIGKSITIDKTLDYNLKVCMECLKRYSLEIVVTGSYSNLCLWNVSCNKFFLIFKTIFPHAILFMYQTRHMKFNKNNNELQEFVKLINL